MGKMIDSNGKEYAITPESVGAYINRGLQKDFFELASESKDDKNFQIAHFCMLHLARHYIMGDEKIKITPKEAFEQITEHEVNFDEVIVKTLVTQFSIRGDEFGDWVENPAKWETLWEIEK